jgi:hypothetical protein
MKKTNFTITAVYFHRLRNITHSEFTVEFKTLLDANAVVKNAVSAEYTALVDALDQEIALINDMKKSNYTERILETDQRIDRCLTGMNAVITAAQHHFDPVVQEAARLLHNRFSAFGDIRRKSYEDETGIINMLLTDLASTEYADSVTLTGLTPWVTELTAAETNFERLLRERYDEIAAKPQGKIKEIRHTIETIYHTMTNRIEAFAVVSDNPEAFVDFIGKLNVIVTYFNEHTHHHVRKDLAQGDHTVIEPLDTQKYTGKAITPVPMVHYREEGKPTVELVLGKDFSITYKNNLNVGMAELILHGKGAYKGQKMATFNIAR